MEKTNVTIIIDQKTDKHVKVTINKNAKLRDLLSEVSKSKNMEGINYLKFVLPDVNLVGPESLDKKLNELEFKNESQSWISPYTLDSNKKNDDENKWEGWIDLKSISSMQNEKNKDSEADKNNSLTLIIFSYDKEVTRLNVTKNTTMQEIKTSLQKQYNLSNEQIDELQLWYMSSDILSDLNETVDQVFYEEDIKNCEVKANARSFDFNLKTSEKVNRKKTVKMA